MKNNPIQIGDTTVAPGEHQTVDLPLAAMYTHNDVQMTVHVINGKLAGPVMFICAAIHGDEINGVEIIRRLLKQKQISRLRGTLLAIPIVNVHGFLSNSRYLPDGRDLNRSFPGSRKGSLAGRIANTFMKQILQQSDYGIDLHTGARHRGNLPQIRADLSNDTAKRMADAFGVPVIVDSTIRDASLREMGETSGGVPILLYEAGEALRFDEVSIRAGVKGILNVMRALGMLPRTKARTQAKRAIISTSTSWVRAPYSGILRTLVPLGAKAVKGSVLGVIGDPLGASEYQVVAEEEGIIIGRTFLPLVHEGEALFHLAHYAQKTDKVFTQVGQFQDTYEPDVAMELPPNPQDTPIP